jgi:lipoprotein-releasing system permease protein
MKKFLPFEWIAAIRFLGEGMIQTMLIVTGVSVGVGVIVFMSALLTGLQADFLRRVFSSQPQIVLLPPEEAARPLRHEANAVVMPTVVKPNQRLRSIDQWQKIIDQIRRRPDVLTVSPIMSGAAFAVRGDADKGINLMGVEPDTYFNIVRIPEKIVAGAPRITGEDILLGTQLAIDLGLGVGDKVRVMTASGSSRTLTIAGVFDLGNKGANQRSAYVALRTAQSLFGLTGGVTSVDVTVPDAYAAEEIAQAITASTGVEADSWIKTNADFFTFVNSQNLTNAAIRFFVGLSVAFGIASVLVVSVVQKSKEIGILRAMGASQGQMSRVFLLQGGIVGFLGSVLGSALGGGILLAWQTYARKPDGTPLFPAVIDLQLLAIAATLATLTGLIAAILPARRAANLDPVVAIRG